MALHQAGTTMNNVNGYVDENKLNIVGGGFSRVGLFIQWRRSQELAAEPVSRSIKFFFSLLPFFFICNLCDFPHALVNSILCVDSEIRIRNSNSNSNLQYITSVHYVRQSHPIHISRHRTNCLSIDILISIYFFSSSCLSRVSVSSVFGIVR